MAEDDLIAYTIELKDQLHASEQAAHQLYEKNIESLAYILQIQKEKSLNEQVLQSKIASLESQQSHLMAIIEDQQVKLQSQDHWEKMTHIWKTLLPIHSPTSPHLPVDFEHLAYILTLLSAKYIQDIEQLPITSPPTPKATSTSRQLLDSAEPRQVVKENTSFMSHLLDEVLVLQSRVRHFDELEDQNTELRRLLQSKSASLVKLQAEYGRMKIENEQQIMTHEDLRIQLR